MEEEVKKNNKKEKVTNIEGICNLIQENFLIWKVKLRIR